jgi:hypothetical protein
VIFALTLLLGIPTARRTHRVMVSGSRPTAAVDTGGVEVNPGEAS